MTMSTSSAPAATADLTSASFTSSAARPEGNAVATLATWIPVPASAAAATGTRSGYTQTAATGGAPKPGRRALAASARTLPGVSCPSSVVRSIMEIARSIAARLLSALTDRLASASARARAPTSSTPGSPRRNRRSDCPLSHIRPLSLTMAIPHTPLSGRRRLDCPPERQHGLLIGPDHLERRDRAAIGGHRERERGQPGQAGRRGQRGERERAFPQQRRLPGQRREHQDREVREQGAERRPHLLPDPLRRRAVRAGEPGAALKVPPDVRAELMQVRHEVGVRPEPLGVDDHPEGVDGGAEVQ